MTSNRRMTMVCFAVTVVAFITLQRHSLNVSSAISTQQGVTVKSYCASDTGQPLVYFSEVFDTRIPKYGRKDDQSMANEFNEYLMGRFDFKGNEYRPVGCPFFDTISNGETSKRDLENQMRQANKQVVDVNWGYTPNEVEIALSANATEHEANGPGRPRPTHTWCLSDTYQGTVYSTGPFATDQNWAQWYQGFNRFLKEKHSFPGHVECKVTTLSDARRLMNARTEGARAVGKRVVDTGWRYDPTIAAVQKAAPKDDDPEPAPQRPAAQTAPADIRQFATAEGSPALAYCQNDRVISGGFDCYCVRRQLYNYRMKHAQDDGPGVQPEPFANLFAKDKLDCNECIVDFKVKMWATSYAQSQRLQPKAAECVAQSFVTKLHAKPFPAHTKEIFNAAVAACK